tara:strand:- start:2 stop:1219 length:1218 start_codon:yes stop_codon:yes gene_type:complete
MQDYKNISAILLFLPVAAFILLNFLSAYYITSYNVYNGDFLGVPLRQSHAEVWIAAAIASLPYLILFFMIYRIAPTNIKSVYIPNLFLYFSLIILTISLLLTVFYGVGMMATGIYSVPSIIKPVVVVINRIEPITLSSLLLLSPYIKWRAALIISSLLLLITIFRGSLMTVPILLMIFFYRFFIVSNNKNNLNSSFWIFLLSLAIIIFIIYFLPQIYEIRDSMRGVSADSMPVFDLIFGKLIGRMSNVSALLIFDWRFDLFKEGIDQLPYFSYLIDALKYIWGGFIKTPVMNHYDYFTSINDHYAYGFYAMQSGTIPAIGISMMKSPLIGVFDIMLTILCIYYVVKLTTFFLGENGKYLAMILMVFPILSGAPNQFALPIYNFIFIIVIFTIIKYLSYSYKNKET